MASKPHRAVRAAMVALLVTDFAPECFVCGPTAFVEAAADILVALGYDPARSGGTA